MKRSVFVCFALALSFFSSILLAQTNANPSAANLGMMQRRAVEAVIWGMPAVNYDLMLREMLNKTDAKVNEVVYWGRPLDWYNQTLTPNPDSIYFMTFFNAKDVGPVVIEIPPANGGSINGNIVNIWQEPLEDAGPSGADKGQGGKYLILPPGYAGEVPAGYIPLSRRPSAATRCSAQTSRATATRMSPNRSPMASGSRSIHSHKRPTPQRRSSPTLRMCCSIPPFAMTKASSRRSTVSSRANLGRIATVS